MASGSNWWAAAPLEIALEATVFALTAISLLILFIWGRRAYRGRYFARRDARAYEIRKIWAKIVALEIAPETWRDNPLDRQLIESILLDRIDHADAEELPQLVQFVRDSGLLDRYLLETRHTRGWKLQRALTRLGRTRAPEAVPALAEALDSENPDTVAAAVRALGHLAIPRGIVPILERLGEGRLLAPPVLLKHALVNGGQAEPSLLFGYLNRVPSEMRDLLAQALAQIATPEMSDDLAILAGDPSPEVRASAARALAACRREFAIGLLFTLVLDEVWFVRLRSVSALGQLHDPGTIEALVRCLCDSHRIVRQRAAMALVPFENEADAILQQVIATKDKYALHAFVSELQRSGRYKNLLRKLREHGGEVLNESLIFATESARQELQPGVTEHVK